MEVLINKNSTLNSLQVSRMGDITEGNFKLKNNGHFLIKNITEENVSVKVKLASSNEIINTTFYPGWNPEIVREIINAPINTLQYGY